MSKTPRTDAQCDLHQFDPRQWYDFARQLETELNDKTAELEEAKKKLEEVQSNCATLNVRCRMWHEDFHILKQRAVEFYANAFDEAAEMASPCSGFVYGKDLRAKADSIRKGEEK